MKIAYSELNETHRMVAKLAMQRLGPIPHLDTLMESWLAMGQLVVEPADDGFYLEQSSPAKRICHYTTATRKIVWYVGLFQWRALKDQQIQVITELPPA